MEEDEESGLLMYRFEHVPFGLYSVFIVSAGVEVETLRGLVVRREGTFFGDKKLPEQREGQAMAAPPNADEEDGDEDGADALALSESSARDEDYIDQDEGDEMTRPRPTRATLTAKAQARKTPRATKETTMAWHDREGPRG